MATFCCGLVLYFALPLFSFGQHPNNLDIFENPVANFIFILACLGCIAYIFR